MPLQSNLIEGGQTVGMAIRAIIVCMVLCVGTLSHPVAAQTEQNGGAIAAGDAAIDDRAIALRIKEIFNELDGLEGVTVVVRSGVVTLRGIVGEAQLSDRAPGSGQPSRWRCRGHQRDRRGKRRFWRTPGARLRTAREPDDPGFQLSAVGHGRAVLLACGWRYRLRDCLRAIGRGTASRRTHSSRISSGNWCGSFSSSWAGVLALDILGATALLGTLLGAAGIVGLAVGFAVRDHGGKLHRQYPAQHPATIPAKGLCGDRGL